MFTRADFATLFSNEHRNQRLNTPLRARSVTCGLAAARSRRLGKGSFHVHSCRCMGVDVVGGFSWFFLVFFFLSHTRKQRVFPASSDGWYRRLFFEETISPKRRNPGCIFVGVFVRFVKQQCSFGCGMAMFTRRVDRLCCFHTNKFTATST